jgi:CheY-like chemotaxis protein
MANKKMKIMIVDDNDNFLEGLKDILISDGYDTITINDSTTVLDVAKMLKPDLIILDLKMIGMNGFEVADRLKRSPATTHIPIIGVSGIFEVENDFEDNFFLMDFCCIFHKPFNPSELIDKIEEVLVEDKSRWKGKEESLEDDILITF